MYTIQTKIKTNRYHPARLSAVPSLICCLEQEEEEGWTSEQQHVQPEYFHI